MSQSYVQFTYAFDFNSNTSIERVQEIYQELKRAALENEEVITAMALNTDDAAIVMSADEVCS